MRLDVSQDAAVEILRQQKTRTQGEKILFCQGTAGTLVLHALLFPCKIS
jgi:hypothetical protein